MATGNLIEVRGVSGRIGSFELADVDLTVAPGEVVGLVGRNGAGKTTLIKVLLGLMRIDDGEVRTLGVAAGELGSTSASARAKEGIGAVFDGAGLPGHLHVRDIGRLMRMAYDSWDDALFDDLVGRLDLEGARGKRVAELSRGMGMKLSLACALAHRPRLLVLDEATAGLDPLARDTVLAVLRDFMDEEGPDGEPVNGVLMSSHITTDLESIADRICCIDDGRIIFNVEKDEVTDHMGIARCRAERAEELARAGVGAPGAAPGAPLHVLPRDYGADVLVPDRFAFAAEHPEIPVDRVSIDDYLAFMLKGR